jgi:hypothetical protein
VKNATFWFSCWAPPLVGLLLLSCTKHSKVSSRQVPQRTDAVSDGVSRPSPGVSVTDPAMLPDGGAPSEFPECPPGLRHQPGRGCVHYDGMPCVTGCEGERGQPGDERPTQRSLAATAARQVIAEMRFLECARLPHRAKVGTIFVRIGSGGNVVEAEVQGSNRRSEAAVCVEAHVRALTFSPFTGPVISLAAPYSLESSSPR